MVQALTGLPSFLLGGIVVLVDGNTNLLGLEGGLANAANAQGQMPDITVIGVAPEVELVLSDGEIRSQVGTTQIVQDVAGLQDQEPAVGLKLLQAGLRHFQGLFAGRNHVASRQGPQAGIPPAGPVDEAAADRLLGLMAELGGRELVGDAVRRRRRVRRPDPGYCVGIDLRQPVRLELRHLLRAEVDPQWLPDGERFWYRVQIGSEQHEFVLRHDSAFIRYPLLLPPRHR